MNRIAVLTTLAGLALGLAACGGDSHHNRPGDNAKNVDFTQFVKQQLAKDGDNLDPVAINNLNFQKNDQDNPNAYDDVLSASE